MDTPPPDAAVTVVVPTHDRRDFLPDLVDGLRAQEHVAFRCVIVDDGSSDGTVERLHELTGDDDRFEIVAATNGGPAAARNRGCEHVREGWIAFVDDDCVPTPTWLSGLLAVAHETGSTVVQGRTAPDPTVPASEQPWLTRSQNIGRWSGRFQTCNLLVDAGQFHAVGGFDERFPPTGFGEDVDLGLRLVAAGAGTAFSDEALVYHRVLPMSLGEFFRRRWRWGQVVRLVRINPTARQIFPHPYVAHRSHLVLWAALPFALFAARRRNWALPAAALGLTTVARARQTSSRGRSFPVRLLWAPVDLAGIATAAVAFVVGSIRERRLLL